MLNKNKEVLGVMKLLGRMENTDQSPREQSLPGTDGRSGWLEMEKTHNHLGSGRDLLRWGLTWAGGTGGAGSGIGNLNIPMASRPALPLPRKPCTSLTPGSKESAWSRGSLQYPVPPPQLWPLLVVPAYGLPAQVLLAPWGTRTGGPEVLYSRSCRDHASQLKLLPPWLHTQKWGHTGCPVSLSHMKCYQKASSPSSCIWPLSQDTFGHSISS